MSEELKLTPITECVTEMDECKDTTTAGLVQYGLRSGCLDSEYHLANRMQELREICLTLVKDTLAEGYSISDATLKLIDVERVVETSKRFSKKS